MEHYAVTVSSTSSDDGYIHLQKPERPAYAPPVAFSLGRKSYKLSFRADFDFLDPNQITAWHVVQNKKGKTVATFDWREEASLFEASEEIAADAHVPVGKVAAILGAARVPIDRQVGGPLQRLYSFYSTLPIDISDLDTPCGELRFMLRPNTGQSHRYRSRMPGVFIDCYVTLNHSVAHLCMPSWSSDLIVRPPSDDDIEEAPRELIDRETCELDEDAEDTLFAMETYLCDLVPAAEKIMRKHIRRMERPAEIQLNRALA